MRQETASLRMATVLVCIAIGCTTQMQRVASAPDPASAPAACGNGLPVTIAQDRARMLRHVLEHEANRLTRWRHVWMGIFGAAVVGQVGLAQWAAADERPVFYVSAVKAALGVLDTPLFSARFSVPIQGDLSPCADLGELQRALHRARQREARGVAWYQYLPGLGVNAAGILYLGVVHDLWAKAFVGGAIGSVVGSIKLFTQPRRLIDGRNDFGVSMDQPWFTRVNLTISATFAQIRFRF